MKRRLKKIKLKRYWIPVGISLAMIAVLFIFQNGTCNQATSDDNTNKVGSKDSKTGDQNPATLRLYALSSTVVVNSTVQFQAAGGTQPYTYHALTGSGTINQISGVYTAGSIVESGVEVAVQDAYGATAYAYVNVIEAPTPTPTPIPGTGITLNITAGTTSVITDSTTTLTVTNGTPPYLFKIMSGGGMVTSSAYWYGTNTNRATFGAPSYAGQTVIRVSDKLSNTGQITINTVVLPTDTARGTYMLTIDQHFVITYRKPASSSYPKLIVFGTGPGFEAAKNCFAFTAGPTCYYEFPLTNYDLSTVYATSYRGIIGFSGRGGNISVEYCIPYNSTGKMVVKQLNGGDLTIAKRRFLSSSSGVLLFNGAYANTANFEIDRGSGEGLYTLTMTGQYSVKKDCSDLGTSTVDVLPW